MKEYSLVGRRVVAIIQTGLGEMRVRDVVGRPGARYVHCTNGTNERMFNIDNHARTWRLL